MSEIDLKALRSAADYYRLPCGCEMGSIDTVFAFHPHSLDCDFYLFATRETINQGKRVEFRHA